MKIMGQSEAGMTLMELIIAIALMSIVVIAAFTGLQFAFTTMSASKDYVIEAYDAVMLGEEDLSNVSKVTPATTPGSIVVDNTYKAIGTGTIEMQWQSGALIDFDSEGIIVERDFEGGTYLEESIYVFIPIDNDDH